MRGRRAAVAVLAAGAIVLPGLVRGAERVVDFSVALVVQPNSTLEVVERIAYDFGDAERHGLFRFIPARYERAGFRYRVWIDPQPVTRDGQAEPFAERFSAGEHVWKIGDPDRTITGQHQYTIPYRVRRAVQVFENRPEIYWNVTGDQWTVPIEAPSFTLLAPPGAAVEGARCFTGPSGSTTSDCQIAIDGRRVTVTTEAALAPGEGLTVAVRLPAGAVTLPGPAVVVTDFLRTNWGFFIPVAVFGLMVWLYRRYGRDPAGRGTIVPEYEPPAGFTPALVGFLIDERVDARDISAALLNLAVQGALRIEYVDKVFGHTYRFHRLKEPGPAASRFEQGLLKAMFGEGVSTVALGDLRATLPTALRTLTAELERDAVAQGLIVRPPGRTRSAVVVAGALVAAVGFFFLSGARVDLFIGCVVSGLIVIAFARALPRRTERGAVATEQIKGFRQFLSVTESDRVKFHQSPVRRPEQFFAYLPYAVALAVEKEWAAQFRDLTIPEPDWYTGRHWTVFNASVLASGVRDFSAAARHQAFPAASAGAGGSGFGGGGGFSGGGFGGGGGGSW